MLLTSATMRQSCRSFASAPVWQSWSSVDGAPVETDCPSRLPSPPVAAAAREHGVEDEDHEADDAEPAAAGENGPAHAAAATHVGDLGRVELGAASEPHGILLPRNWHSHARHVSRQPACRTSARCRSRLRRLVCDRALEPLRRPRGTPPLRPDDEGARRPAAHGCDAGDATVAGAPRSHSPRRDRRDHPLRRQHHGPVPAPGADGRAAERRPAGGSAAAPDRDRPGGRTRPPPPLGRAGGERAGARRVERGADPASGAPRRPRAPGRRDHVDLAPVADVPGAGVVHGS